MKISKKLQTEIVNNLYTIIDINRVGSDEIDVIEDILEGFENLTLKKLTVDKLTEIKSELLDLKNWSDRLGSDENYIINHIIQIIDEVSL